MFISLHNENLCFFVRLKKEKNEDEEDKKEQGKKVPLSLEELLAKKKAEEEAQSKVCITCVVARTEQIKRGNRR